MKTKLAEREMANAKIKHELKDQDELLTRLTDMDNENRKMSQEIDRLKDVEQKMIEHSLQQSNIRGFIEMIFGHNSTWELYAPVDLNKNFN